MKSLVTQRIFGKDTSSTIYYLTGYDTRISTYRLHIYVLVLLGYRVVAFDYHRDILYLGKPQYLVDTLHDLAGHITSDKMNRKVAGVLGVSLGSWIGLNLLSICDISRGVFFAGGASIVHTIWDMPALRSVKAKYVAKGYTDKELHEVWGTYDYTPDGSRFSFAHFALICSDKDEVIDITNVKENVIGWQKDNSNITFIRYKWLKHMPVIILAMLRIPTTMRLLQKN